MTPFASAYIYFSSITAFVAVIVLVVLILLMIFRTLPFSSKVLSFVSDQAILLSFLITLGALAGSLIFSNVIGFIPCDLCWIQRIFIYPQVVMFAVALWRKDNSVFRYALPLTAIGGLVALYQTYLQFGGTAITGCAAAAVSCAKVYFLEFGFISIPTMSLTVFVALFLIGCAVWLDKKNEAKNQVI